MYTSNKCSKIDYAIDAYLCHCRLGHINKNRIDRLTKDGILNINDCESLLTYEFLLLEKITKSPFTRKGERTGDILSLVHSDVCRPMNTNARGEYYYSITFTDDLFRYGYVYLMKYKSESFEIFKRFHSEVKKAN